MNNDDNENHSQDARVKGPRKRPKKWTPAGIVQSAPAVESPPRKYLVTHRAPTPEVTSMIADAYHVIDQQLAQFRARASLEQFDVKDLTGLHKLVCTLKILEDGEDRRIKAYNLSGLDKESLELLESEAARYAPIQGKPDDE